MISIVIISKDEASLDDTLTAVTSQVEALGEPSRSSWLTHPIAD